MLVSTKNLNFKQLSLIASGAIGFLACILVWLVADKLLWAIIIAVVLFIFSYYLMSYLLDVFVYRKIKLLYKLVSMEKESMKQITDLNDKTIDDVRKDISRWAIEKRGEILRLQNNESFRKEFLMNLAHELRTPIFSIQGYIATLLDGEIDNPEVNVRFLENAAKSVDRLSGLVDDLREISYYESNRIRLDKTAFSIQKRVKKIYNELKPLADERSIVLGIKKGTEGDFLVWADAVRIEQVLINLIQNAIKYGKEGGYVLAGFYLIDNKQVLIEITDNGMGMHPDQVIRVFERFFRTDEARTAVKEGNGLGLAITKHIIEAHNQTINCRSQIGSGSTFSFTLEQDR